MHFHGTTALRIGSGCWPRPALSSPVRIARVVLVLTLLGTGLFSGRVLTASAATVSSGSIGVDVLPAYQNGWTPTDLSTASAAGVGIVRMELIQGNKAADALVKLAAQAHLRVAPMLGLSTQPSASAAPAAMATYVTSFAKRYGPGGSFWAQNRQLPYLPVDTFEIGNEPNIPLQYVQDSTHLHWSNPAIYASVYEAARSALHVVDPSGVAVVGGLADSGGLGVDLRQGEQWLAALNPSVVDAVGFHPYTWQAFPNNLSMMASDTQALRSWMNAHGMRTAPIEINELGACGVSGVPGCGVAFSSSFWGSAEATFMQWALCTPSLGVGSFIAFYWGAVPHADTGSFLPLVSSGGTVLPYGQEYLSAARMLTTGGCPSSVPPPPPAPPAPPRAMRLRLRSIHVHGRRLIVLVRVLPGTGHVRVVAVRRHRRIRLHLIRRRLGRTLLTFAARLPRGRWTVVVICEPPPGYATPPRPRRSVRIRR